MIKINDIITGTFHSNSSGSAYLMSTDLPKDIYIHRNNTNKALHLDTVKIRIITGNGRSIEGEVIEVIERLKTEFVGIIQISPRYAFFIPDSNKSSVDFFIPLSKLLGAKDGQKVVVAMTEWKDDNKNPNGEVIKILGYAGEHETEIHSILEEYDLPYTFDPDIELEAEQIPVEITQSEIDNRRDMRNVTTFTIDPVDAKDFDDALSVEWVGGEMFVGIHIADVSHYLRPDTDLDKEAYARGTSVYVVDRCVPMLPEILSNGLCSLRPNEDKLCFSAVFKMDHNGTVLDEWFGRTVINSDVRYSYEEAQEVIDNQDNAKIGEIIKGKCDTAIIALNRLAKKMRKKRLGDGSISFDKQEIRFKLDEHNKPVGIVFKNAKDSNKLIEEFMLLANKHVAQFINSKKLPMVNRAHDKPNETKLDSLKEFVKQFGYIIKTDNALEISRSLNQLLEDVKGKSEENMIENLVVRTMQKANYTTKNIGHYGLGFKDYTHFTSPIRRYPDVMVHRLLAMYLDGKYVPKLDKIESRCVYLSEREKKAQKAERESIKYMQCKFLSDKIGMVYNSVITSVTDFGLFATIDENGCDCLIKLNNINGTWCYDFDNHYIKEFNTNETIRLGDKVMVVIIEVDVEKKNIYASLIKI